MSKLELRRMTGILSDKSIRYIQWVTCAACAAVFVFCIVKTLHWQVVWDQSVIRYVRFLMSQGLRPYSDITDMYMPGCYLLEACGMAIFGWGDHAWRIYEYFLIAGIAAAGIALGGRRYWMTGVFSATIFLLVRFSDGEAFSLERNEIMGLLDVLALAFFFLGLERRRPLLIGISSTLICLAATMKPGGFLLDVLLIGLLVIVLRRERVSLRPYLLYAVGGMLIGCLVVVAFLIREHAVKGFLFIVLKVWPMFRTMSPRKPLAINLVPKFIVPLAAFAAIAAFQNRKGTGWQRWAFFLAMVYGGVSYKLEGGEARYHRYVFIVLMATWIGWELALAMGSQTRASRAIGVAGVALLLGVSFPFYLVQLHRVTQPNGVLETYPAALQSDLEQLGGAKLQGQVECLEMVDGCLRTLYQMRLVQNTGSTGDLLLFTSIDSPAVRYYRDWYTRTQQAHPANVLVVGNFSFETTHRSFDRIDTWPAFAADLRAQYVLVGERHFGSGNVPGYRVYVRKGTDLLRSRPIPKP